MCTLQWAILSLRATCQLAKCQDQGPTVIEFVIGLPQFLLLGRRCCIGSVVMCMSCVIACARLCEVRLYAVSRGAHPPFALVTSCRSDYHQRWLTAGGCKQRWATDGAKSKRNAGKRRWQLQRCFTQVQQHCHSCDAHSPRKRFLKAKAPSTSLPHQRPPICPSAPSSTPRQAPGQVGGGGHGEAGRAGSTCTAITI